MNKSLFILLIFLSFSTHSQISAKILVSTNPKKKNAVDSVFAFKQKPYFLADAAKKKYFNLCSLELPSPKTILQKCEAMKEIDLNALKNQTKWVYFRMKMWKYFQ